MGTVSSRKNGECILIFLAFILRENTCGQPSQNALLVLHGFDASR